VNAYKADNPEKPTVIIHAQDFRLPEVFRHIEAGKTVLVIPATQPSPLPTERKGGESHPASLGGTLRSRAHDSWKQQTTYARRS
jgi:hypothetical protein